MRISRLIDESRGTDCGRGVLAQPAHLQSRYLHRSSGQVAQMSLKLQLVHRWHAAGYRATVHLRRSESIFISQAQGNQRE